jgi:hypothetical protein
MGRGPKPTFDLGIPEDWGHPKAYARLTDEVFQAARNVTAPNPAWIGSLEPHAPLRAFDKCLWWFGGGNAGTAAEVSNPWGKVDELGLARLVNTDGP